jgi:hypothetical protein
VQSEFFGEKSLNFLIDDVLCFTHMSRSTEIAVVLGRNSLKILLMLIL